MEIQAIAFPTQKKFEVWMHKNHSTEAILWLRFYKRDSGIKTITYSEALDVALCYGWIDSQVKAFDDESYLQKFSPRRTNSPWSKINRDHIARLTKENRMQPAGLAEVERVKRSGKWETIYIPAQVPSVANSEPSKVI